MKTKKFRPSKRKPIREIQGKKHYSGEQSPYWEFMAAASQKRVQSDGTNDIMEDPLANSDMLSEEDSLWHRPLTEVGELQKQAVEETIDKLSPRERMVFDLCADQGETLEATADRMGVTLATVQTLLTRVRNKIKRRFEQIMKAEK